MVYLPSHTLDDDPYEPVLPRTWRFGALAVAAIAAAALALGAFAAARGQTLTERSQGVVIIPVEIKASLAERWPGGAWFPAGSTGSILSATTAYASGPPPQPGSAVAVPTATLQQAPQAQAAAATPTPAPTRSTDLRAASASTPGSSPTPSATPGMALSATTATPAPSAAAATATRAAGTPTPFPTSIAFFTATPTPRVSAAATPTPPSARPRASDTSRLVEWEQAMFVAHNEEREKAGVGTLKLNAGLTDVARQRARDMAERNYFAHVAPTGEDAFDLLRENGITYWSAGENIAMNTYSASETVRTAMTGFMESTPHKKNLLDADYELIGVGVAIDGDKKYFCVIFTGFRLP